MGFLQRNGLLGCWFIVLNYLTYYLVWSMASCLVPDLRFRYKNISKNDILKSKSTLRSGK